jgi:threonine dehydratase
MITFADIEAARCRIGDAVFLSPCSHSEAISRITGARTYLKLENLQMTGSFKERGACNKLLSLTPEERARGVVTASAGNHAQGVAYHATRLGVSAKIVMPEGTPLIKVQSTKSLGGQVVLFGANYDDAAEEAERIRVAENRVYVHPFNDELVMAGQGTVGLELIEQNPYLDAVVVSIGGGGLASGIAVAIKETNPKIKVYGVQTKASPSMKRAIEAHGPVTLPAARTIADGISVKRAGDLTYEVIAKYVDDIALVDEEEIAESILILLEREKTVAEGAGAAPLAALVHHRLGLEGRKVAVVISGGNIDVNFMSRIIERGLVHRGRLMRLRVRLPDVAGALADLLRVVAQTKANVVEIRHDRFFNIELGETAVEIVLETRGYEHVDEVRAVLTGVGVKMDEG